MHLDLELRGALGEAELRKCCVYVAIIQVTPEFYVRGQTSLFRRDLTANELTSLGLIVKFRDNLPVSTKGIRRKLQTTTERGNFCSPMSILQRLGESVAGFQDLSEKVLDATGNLRIQLLVETLPAMLAAIEVIKEYQWSWTK